MPVTALRSHCPRFICRYRQLQLRAASSESNACSSALHTTGLSSSDSFLNSSLASNSHGKSAALDPSVQAQLKRMLRVDHAGEFAAGFGFYHNFTTACAVRIYQGQRMVLGGTSDGPLLHEMQAHEEAHLVGISEAAHRHRADASVLLPVWSAAALALGVGSALLGRNAAMACTQAVETVITQHYNDQLRQLHALPSSPEVEALISTVKKYRDDEQSHHDIATKNGADSAPFHSLFTGIIRAGCNAAIKIAERI